MALLAQEGAFLGDSLPVGRAAHASGQACLNLPINVHGAIAYKAYDAWKLHGYAA